MIAIVCLDDKNGMSFNHRRQSRDACLRREILTLTRGRRLWMAPYSEGQFGPEDAGRFSVSETFLEEAAPGEKRRYRGYLTLTGPGREKAEALRGIVVEKFQAVDEELDGEDVAAFYRVFNAVAEKLEDI